MTTSSFLPNHSRQDIEHLTFAERVQFGAENAVRCMGVTASDRVFIITDYERESIARHVATAVLDCHANVTVHFLEHYGERPLTTFSDELRNDLIAARPTVTYYIATAKPGEIAFRIPLLPFLVQELKVRGSDVTAMFNSDWKWIPCHGRYHEQGKWGNLPEGEVFTAPATVDGVLVCDVLGDYFSEKYGVLKHPVTIIVKNGYITHITSENEVLAQELHDYLFSVPNGNRAGEFAIGTLTSLKKLVGNLLQDEKMPGLHVAFGNPYPQFTGADWDAKVHVDVIPSCCTIEVDGRTIMRDGAFTI